MKALHERTVDDAARVARDAAASSTGAYASGGTSTADAQSAARDAMYAAPSSTVIAQSAASRKRRRGLLYKLIDVDVIEALAVGETEIYEGGWSHVAGELESHLNGQAQHSVQHACGAAHSASLAADGELSFMYRYISRESCSQFDSLPLTSLTISGTLRTWGWGDRGQLGHGGTMNEAVPQVVRFFLRTPTLAVRHVCCGEDHTAVLTRNAQVFAWGDGRRGQLGLGPDALFVHTPCRVDVPVAAQISCGGHHTMALAEDGSVWTWGSGAQIGHGVFSGCGDSSLPRALDALTHLRVRHIECGLAYSAAVTHTGALYTWGDNKQGQLGQGDRLSRFAPRRVDRFPETVATTSCGSRHMAALTSSGQLFIWGWGAHGQLGLGSDLSDKTSPVLLSQCVVCFFCWRACRALRARARARSVLTRRRSSLAPLLLLRPPRPPLAHLCPQVYAHRRVGPAHRRSDRVRLAPQRGHHGRASALRLGRDRGDDSQPGRDRAGDATVRRAR
jgi:hypothetical protein